MLRLRDEEEGEEERLMDLPTTMASCEVEPLDLSMDHRHDVYEKHFEGMMTSGVMKKKMEALAKDMSHFTYKDLWTECCRRYKDIVKKLLGYEAYSHIQETSELNSIETVSESDIIRRCRKRRASGESTDSGSGRSDDFALPLKKRHLRSDYQSNDFDTTEPQPSDDNDPLDLGSISNNPLHKSSQYSDSTVEESPIGPLNLGSNVNYLLHKNTLYCNSAAGQSLNTIDTQSERPKKVSSDDECIIVCSDNQSGEKDCSSSYQDEPCDLTTYSIKKTAIPSLAKYDNTSETSDKSEEARRLGLLARLLSEPKSNGKNLRHDHEIPRHHRTDAHRNCQSRKKKNNDKSPENDNDDSCVEILEPDVVVLCETYRGGVKRPGGPRGGCSKPDLYASPYLNTSTDRGQYSGPARRHPSSLSTTSQSDNTRKYNSQKTVNIFHIPPLPVLPSFRKRRTDSTKVIGQGHSGVIPGGDKATPVNTRESRRDKILKRLLEYEDAKGSDGTKNRSKETEGKTNSAKPCKNIKVRNGFNKQSKFGDKTFWDFIKEACDRVAAMDQGWQ